MINPHRPINPRQWTPQEDEIVRRLYAHQGPEAVQLALPRFRSLPAITKYANKIRLYREGYGPQPQRRRWANGRLLELETLASLGLTASEIALRMGETRNAIIGALWRRGVALSAARSATAAPDPVMTGCRWLDGEPREYRYCGAPTVGPDRSWCAEHRARVYYVPDRPARHRH